MKKMNKTRVYLDLPAKLVELADTSAARQLLNRTTYIRSAILAALVKDGLVNVDAAPQVSAYEAEINRLFH